MSWGMFRSLPCAFPSASQVHACRLLPHCPGTGQVAQCNWSCLKLQLDWLDCISFSPYIAGNQVPFKRNKFFK